MRNVSEFFQNLLRILGCKSNPRFVKIFLKIHFCPWKHIHRKWKIKNIFQKNLFFLGIFSQGNQGHKPRNFWEFFSKEKPKFFFNHCPKDIKSMLSRIPRPLNVDSFRIFFKGYLSYFFKGYLGYRKIYFIEYFSRYQGH